MIPSFNEINALCRKAARGSGLSWGVAEDAGFAAEWLWAQGVNGPGLLLKRLNERSEPCPFAFALACLDRGAVTDMGTVRYGMLCVPFLAQLYDGVRIQYGDGALVASKTALRIETPFENGPHMIRCEPAPAPAQVTRTRREIEPRVWAGLEQLAAKTYAPASDASRAGAGPA